ncbi:anhydro-N-acetylmuramic acid kinase [Ghiorsea bivora]|uniref:anhydro-N-acetylmuramic acid kinase n=1 Tax=Ghiorsea bivora TaxID=1485545 RepID=UPI00057108A6|nr:anhydro-N-acetylmuramic acid kinase [Ghiorsea bivora]
MAKIGQQTVYYVGLMSGTSLDGIDAAVVSMAGDDVELVAFVTCTLEDKLKEPILRLNQPGFDEIDAMAMLDRALGFAFADAALQAIEKAGLEPKQIVAIGSHGQTLRHRPQGIDNSLPFTLQIGDAATIAEKTGITVVSDFRKRDIAACGQGAPLVPFVHQRLFAQANKNIAVLNIGGIANITYLGANGLVLGFDTGPGNMLMDALMQTMTDARFCYDKGGELAASGDIYQPLLEDLLQHVFFKKIPPRSTGREDFGEDVVQQIMAVDMPDADKMATACAFTVQSIVASLQHLPEQPDAWYICGGGAFNKHLMQQLREELAPAQVQTTTDIGLPVEAVEAVAFAVLAERTLAGEVNTLSAVTGALHDVSGGQVILGKNAKVVVNT